MQAPQPQPPPQPPLVDPLPPSQAPLSATATTILLNNNNNNPDSVESSPRCRTAEPWPDDHPLLPRVPGAKLRLMISYGGHIMPRPHDKSLSYVGGDTRMVAVDRHTSLKDLCSRLSRTLLHGRPFTLKYQLPNEELDNLVTVTTDEDLENMVEEYDHLSSKSSSSPPSRLRVFLFFSKPDTALSMESLLDDAKSETWFVDALNNSRILSRVVSDSAAVDECLVNLDVPSAGGSSNDLEGNNKQMGDVHSVPAVVVESNSSSCYGSSSSSMATLPPIKVCVDENGGSRLQLVMEEQFAQMDFGTAISSSGAAAADIAMPAIPAQVTMVTTTDEDRSLLLLDHHHHQVPPTGGGFRKPTLPLQPRTFTAHFGLPSPDSVASDSSVHSANSYSKAVYYQEQVQQAASHVDDNNKAPPLPNLKSETIISISDQSQGLQKEQVQDWGYTLPQQMDQNHQQQQQFVYIHHPASNGQVPMSPYYYTVYAPPIVASSHHHHHHHQQQQQQYPVYVMPAGTTQPHNMTMQSNNINIADPNNNNNNNVVVASSSTRPLIPQSSAAAAAAYMDATTPPIYPTKLVTQTTLPPADVAPTVYQAPVAAAAAAAAAASTPVFVQIPQQHYVGMPQNSNNNIHLTTKPNAIATSATPNYGYEYGGGPMQQDQVYYTQQQSSVPQPPQYQSMTPAAAAAALSDVSKQFPLDNIQQPTRTTTQPV